MFPFINPGTGSDIGRAGVVSNRFGQCVQRGLLPSRSPGWLLAHSMPPMLAWPGTQEIAAVMVGGECKHSKFAKSCRGFLVIAAAAPPVRLYWRRQAQIFGKNEHIFRLMKLGHVEPCVCGPFLGFRVRIRDSECKHRLVAIEPPISLACDLLIDTFIGSVCCAAAASPATRVEEH